MNKPRVAAILIATTMMSGQAPVAIASTAQPAPVECLAPRGWNAVEKQGPRFVVLGELHGTEQSPHFAFTLACAQALKKKRVLVAIEHSSTGNAALQQVWQLPSGQFEPALAQIGWSGRTDGVASKAMFDMVVRLHLLKERGLPISLVAFNGFKDKAQADKYSALPGQGSHEAAQAENITAAADAGTYDIVLVLVGNLHAKKSPVVRGGMTFEPMAMRLANYGKVMSLDMRYGTGTAWNCLLKAGITLAPGQRIGPDDIVCSGAPTAGNAKFVGSPFISLSNDKQLGQPNDYDGYFWVGAVTASPPAFR